MDLPTPPHATVDSGASDDARSWERTIRVLDARLHAKSVHTAREQFLLALTITEAVYGAASIDAARVRGQLGRTLLALGRLDDADAELSTAEKIFAAKLEPDDPAIGGRNGANG